MDILNLPQELLSQVLSYLGPQDVIFDNPQDAWSQLGPSARALTKAAQDDWDWHSRLKSRLNALIAISDEWTLSMLDNPPSGAETVAAILDLIETARPGPTEAELQRGAVRQMEDSSSLNMARLPSRAFDYSVRLDRLLRGSFEPPSAAACDHTGPAPSSVNLWHSIGRPTTRSMSESAGAESSPSPSTVTKLRSVAAARLHVLAGRTHQESNDVKALGSARRIVYDWEATNESNDYGPFNTDGNVDWPRLEAVVSVASSHFSQAVRSQLTLPQGFGYSIPHRTIVDPSVPEDWAGVTGTWCGTYVFLNWEDLLHFNAMADVVGRPSLDEGPESCGGPMKLELKLDTEGKIKDDESLKTDLPYCDDLPPLYFSGLSRSWDFRLATGVRGMACLTPSGREVRWRVIVHYGGADQWQLEAVQPGGIRSGPLYGLWTSCGHEEGGPVGPLIYAPEELCKTTAVVLVGSADHGGL